MASNAGEYTQEFRTVKTFGAVGDGVTDDSVAIQAAIDYAESLVTSDTANASTGVDVLFPPGAYLIGTTLTVQKNGIRLVGPGGNGAILTGNTILVNAGDPTNTFRVTDVAFKGLIFKSSSATNATAALKLYRTVRALITECNFEGFSTAIDSYRTTTTQVSKCRFTASVRTSAGNAFIQLQGLDETVITGTTYTPGGNFFLSDCDLNGVSSTSYMESALRIMSCDGFYATNCHIYNCKYGLNVVPDASAANHDILDLFFDNCYFDGPASTTSGQRQVVLGGTVKETITLADASTDRSVYENIRFDNCYLRGSLLSQYGVLIDVADGDTWESAGNRKLQRITFTGGAIRQADINGVLARGSSQTRVEAFDVLFDGVTFDTNNGGGAVSNGSAMSLECQSATVTGCYFGADAVAAPNVCQFTTTVSGSETPSFVCSGNNFSNSNYTDHDPIHHSAVSGTLTRIEGNQYPGVGQDTSKTVKATTTDATPTVIWSKDIPPTISGRITVEAAASDDTVAQYGVYTITGRFIRTTAGAAAWLGADPVNDYTNDSGGMPAAPIALAFATNTLNLTVTGIAATTITWAARIEIVTSK